MFPLATAHWTEKVEGLTMGLTLCAQPRRILAQQLCERVRSNRGMHHRDRTVGYMIARESSRDASTKLLYCIEAIVALMMQAYLVSSATPQPQDMITTVVIDEVHNRSAHGDYVLALTLAAMQRTPDLRLVLMSATGDHSLVRERIPYCQQLVMKGAMHNVKRCFLERPLDRSANLLNQMAQIVITYHNNTAGNRLSRRLATARVSMSLIRSWCFFLDWHRFTTSVRFFREPLIWVGRRCSSRYLPWSESHRRCECSICGPSSTCCNVEVSVGTEPQHL